MTAKYNVVKVGKLYVENFWGNNLGVSLAPKEKASRYEENAQLNKLTTYLTENEIPFKLIEVIVTEVEHEMQNL